MKKISIFIFTFILSAMTGTMLLAAHMRMSSTTSAGTVLLQMKLNIDHKPVTNHTIRATYGTTSKVVQNLEKNGDKMLLEITPTRAEKNKNAVLLSFKITKVHDGAESVLTSSQVTTSLGTPARIIQVADAKQSFKTLDIELLAK